MVSAEGGTTESPGRQGGRGHGVPLGELRLAGAQLAEGREDFSAMLATGRSFSPCDDRLSAAVGWSRLSACFVLLCFALLFGQATWHEGS